MRLQGGGKEGGGNQPDREEGGREVHTLVSVGRLGAALFTRPALGVRRERAVTATASPEDDSGNVSAANSTPFPGGLERYPHPLV